MLQVPGLNLLKSNGDFLQLFFLTKRETGSWLAIYGSSFPKPSMKVGPGNPTEVVGVTESSAPLSMPLTSELPLRPLACQA